MNIQKMNNKKSLKIRPVGVHVAKVSIPNGSTFLFHGGALLRTRVGAPSLVLGDVIHYEFELPPAAI